MKSFDWKQKSYKFGTRERVNDDEKSILQWNETKRNFIFYFCQILYCKPLFKGMAHKCAWEHYRPTKTSHQIIYLPPCYCSVILHSTNDFLQTCYTNLAVLWVQFIVRKEGKRKAVDFQLHQTCFQHSTFTPCLSAFIFQS